MRANCRATVAGEPGLLPFRGGGEPKVLKPTMLIPRPPAATDQRKLVTWKR